MAVRNVSDQSVPVVVAACVEQPLPEDARRAAMIYTTRSARQTLSLMRLIRTDLVLTGLWLNDMTVWQMIEQIKAAWPWQRWILAAPDIGRDDEIRARSLGAAAIFTCNTHYEQMCEIALQAHHDNRHATTPSAIAEVSRTRTIYSSFSSSSSPKGWQTGQ